ncbi:arginine--tRNA ligase [Patescibacteria group bacterium]|nr:arginine--tRNA ligase [Patescibacteria group bacterium]MBU1870966.1 arginine--tRNA ligase [Patescibacteria group bacterium]
MTKNELLNAKLKQYLIEYFKDLGVKSPEINLEKPALSEHGDITSNSSLKYAKELGKNPFVIANGAIDYLKAKEIAEIADVKFAAPGYINFYLNSKYVEDILRDVIALGNKYGNNDLFKGEKWVIEHTSPNPNKAMHLGHLRNNLIGMSITRLLEFCGAEVVCDSVDNNRGIAIAKLMWGFLVHMKKNDRAQTSVEYWHSHREEWYNPDDINQLPDVFVTNCYVMGATDFKNDSSVEKIVRDIVVKWENNDILIRELWAHVLKYSYEGINRTLNRVGNRWDKTWHEHEHYQKGKEYVELGLTSSIFTRLEDGAILTNLTDYNLPDTILLKKDGTSLYITQDIALTAMKKELYKANKLVWVIGPEQSMAMKQLFAVCEQLGVGKLNDFTHVSYGYVGLKTDTGFKKMSSRDGTVVLIDDVIDNAKNKILEGPLKDRNVDEAIELAEKLSLAAVKFSLLKVERTQDVAFDVEKATEMQGDTGVYILYTYARINSILRKASLAGFAIEPQAVDTANDIVKKLALFGVVVIRSVESFSAHHIAQFLLQLCSDFNSWYNREIILDGSMDQPHKLAAAKAVSQVIKNGLVLLGIDVVEKM